MEDNTQQLDNLKQELETLKAELTKFKELFNWHKHTGTDGSLKYGRVFFGKGVPSLTAIQGSLYLRTDGSSTSTRAYINTDGGTTWTSITTAA